MKRTYTYSFINVVGKIWMPAVTCSQQLKPDSHDVENMRDDDGNITRESVERWLMLHTGDFQSIQDFYADIETPEGINHVFDWASEIGEMNYLDTLPSD